MILQQVGVRCETTFNSSGNLPEAAEWVISLVGIHVTVYHVQYNAWMT